MHSNHKTLLNNEQYFKQTLLTLLESKQIAKFTKNSILLTSISKQKSALSEAKLRVKEKEELIFELHLRLINAKKNLKDRQEILEKRHFESLKAEKKINDLREHLKIVKNMNKSIRDLVVRTSLETFLFGNSFVMDFNIGSVVRWQNTRKERQLESSLSDFGSIYEKEEHLLVPFRILLKRHKTVFRL